MYDYIPMKFNFDYKKYDGSFGHYYLEAVSEERQYFRVAWAGQSDFFMDDYHIGSLIASMKRGCLIDGMTLDELHDSYYYGLDNDCAIDICGLL